jgi:GT2 family glycosyltransferase
MPRAYHSPSSILSIVVIYNRDLAQSQSFSSLLQILKERPEWAKHFSLVVYDNSPQPQSHSVAADFSIDYVHDASNGGLARAYNYALARAESEEREWLLLLDQDTSLSAEFISELLATSETLHSRSEVAAIIPKLQANGKIESPSSDFFEQIRRQFQNPQPAIKQDVAGLQQQRLCSYNSGSALRVAALKSIGGFPAEFWLDFLDHAVFHALYSRGYRVYVMRATLAHDSSYSDIGSLPSWRLHNILLARTLYVKKHGSFIDRTLYRIWLLRHSRSLRRACKDPRMWKETALQAVLLRVPKDERLLT